MSVPRILHVISRLDGYGAARLVRHIAAEQARRGWGVSVAPLEVERAIAAELAAAGVAAAPLGGRWRCDPFALGRLMRVGRRGAVDLIHAWDSRALAYATLANMGAPIVAAWTTAGAEPRWVSRISRGGLATIPPGATPRESSWPRDAALHELGLPGDARVIAMAGPLMRRKEIDEAIWCFELVRVLHPNARLVVFGDGPDRPRLERYAELVSEPACVVFPGFRGDWVQLAAAIDVYWQLDAARVTPFALLEAMAAGVPAVVSNVPALIAAAMPGVAGLAVGRGVRAEVARATDSLLSDAALAEKLGRGGAECVAARWSLAKSAAVCEALYRRVGPRSLTE
jgi:glycosyltransferase involved in cell wall biosynthesis